MKEKIYSLAKGIDDWLNKVDKAIDFLYSTKIVPTILFVPIGLGLGYTAWKDLSEKLQIPRPIIAESPNYATGKKRVKLMMNVEPRIDVHQNGSNLEIKVFDGDDFCADVWWEVDNINDSRNPKDIAHGMEMFLPAKEDSFTISTKATEKGDYIVSVVYIDGKNFKSTPTKRFRIN